MTSKYNILVITETYTTSLMFETKEELYNVWIDLKKNTIQNSNKSPAVTFVLLDPDNKSLKKIQPKKKSSPRNSKV